MDDSELTRIAVAEIVREMGASKEQDYPKERKVNPLGKTNKRFLGRTLNSMLTHNRREDDRTRRNCQEKLRHLDQPQQRRRERSNSSSRHRRSPGTEQIVLDDSSSSSSSSRSRSSSNSTTSTSSSSAGDKHKSKQKRKTKRKTAKRKKRPKSSESDSSAVDRGHRNKSRPGSGEMEDNAHHQQYYLNDGEYYFEEDPNMAIAAAYNHINHFLHYRMVCEASSKAGAILAAAAASQPAAPDSELQEFEADELTNLEDLPVRSTDCACFSVDSSSSSSPSPSPSQSTSSFKRRTKKILTIEVLSSDEDEKDEEEPSNVAAPDSMLSGLPLVETVEVDLQSTTSESEVEKDPQPMETLCISSDSDPDDNSAINERIEYAEEVVSLSSSSSSVCSVKISPLANKDEQAVALDGIDVEPTSVTQPLNEVEKMPSEGEGLDVDSAAALDEIITAPTMPAALNSDQKESNELPEDKEEIDPPATVKPPPLMEDENRQVTSSTKDESMNTKEAPDASVKAAVEDHLEKAVHLKEETIVLKPINCENETGAVAPPDNEITVLGTAPETIDTAHSLAGDDTISPTPTPADSAHAVTPTA